MTFPCVMKVIKDMKVPGILLLFGWYRYRKKVPVSEKFVPLKRYRYQYRKNLVPVPEDSREFSAGTRKFPGIFHFLGGSGIKTGKNWSLKKVPVPEKIGPEKVPLLEKFGPGKKYRHTLMRISLCISAFL